jgi:hypothetical protein
MSRHVKLVAYAFHQVALCACQTLSERQDASFRRTVDSVRVLDEKTAVLEGAVLIERISATSCYSAAEPNYQHAIATLRALAARKRANAVANVVCRAASAADQQPCANAAVCRADALRLPAVHR